MALQHIALPHAPFKISNMTFGAWSIAGGFNWGDQDERDSKAALRAAYDLGITFFDTAKAYGNGKSEQLIAQELGDVRDQIIIGTKILPQDFKYQDLISDCEERLQYLNTDYIDLLQLHWPNWEIPVAETFEALEKLKKDGKIRAYGVSNFGVQDLKDSLNSKAQITTNQLPYNLIWRAIEFDILPMCQREHIPVICYSSIMQGLLAGKFNAPNDVPIDRARSRHFSSDRLHSRHDEPGCEALTFQTLQKIKAYAQDVDMSMANLSMAWLLAQPGIASIIVGARNAHQVERNVKALDVSLTPDQIQYLNEITLPLKMQLGKNPDLWQSNSRYR